jgi:hypothetical protein
VPVHPTAFHAARPRWGASGAKSDPGGADGYKLADYLRTDGHRLRRLGGVPTYLLTDNETLRATVMVGSGRTGGQQAN